MIPRPEKEGVYMFGWIRAKKPMKSIPNDLLDKFTMEGRVQLLYLYCNNVRTRPIVHQRWQIQAALGKIASGEVGLYREVDRWLYEALKRHPIRGRKVAIMGSDDQGFGPWYECICLHYGGNPTTIDYHKIRFDDARIKFMSVTDHGKTLGEQFDAAISISAFEHDGLGRYGDPIDPDGDLKALRKMKSTLKKGGLLFLSVPMGVDKIVFNAHRIYGRVRLPLLLQGWTRIDSVGFEESLLDRDTGEGWEPRTANGELMHPDYPDYEPILVLRND